MELAEAQRAPPLTVLGGTQATDELPRIKVTTVEDEVIRRTSKNYEMLNCHGHAMPAQRMGDIRSFLPTGSQSR